MLRVPKLKSSITFFVILLLPAIVFSQSFNSYQYFTTKDGLPSNFIYGCVQDKQGFLWIATDEGVARFDGRNFELYTTENGLPDVEVLEILMDSSGKIWANSFKHSPSYYDQLTNSFINEKNDTTLTAVKSSTVTYSFALHYGGVVFVNKNGNYFFGKNITFLKTSGFAKGFCLEYRKNELLVGTLNKAFLYNRDILKDSISFNTNEPDSLPSYKVFNDELYDASNLYELRRYYDIDIRRKQFKFIKTRFPLPVLSYSITKNFVCVCLENGEIDILNKYSLQLLQKLNISATMNNAFEDSNGNLWICSSDKGLIRISSNQVQKKVLPDTFLNTSFLSVAVDTAGNVLAGNRFGEIVKITKRFEINKISNADRASWIRKILILHNKVYSISERGLFNNYLNADIQTDTLTPILYFPSLKAGVVYSDSTILLGNIRFLMLVNIYKRSSEVLYSKRRITAVTATANKEIYFGSTDGLFKFIKKDSINNLSLTQKNELLQNRITSLASTKDNLVWAATASNGIIVLSHDSVIANITTKSNLSNDLCRTIYVHDSTVWVGTDKGVSKINYKLAHNTIAFLVQNLAEKEGLHNELVNDITEYHDTMYAATTNGVIFFPANITSKKQNVNTLITNVNINGKDTDLLSTFNLAYNQNNINLRFSTIDLTGSAYTWQYRINNKAWIKTSTNSLSLQLSPGSYAIQIKAVDINNRVIEKKAEINFIIKPAIWQTIWFWIIVSVSVTIIILWRYNQTRIKNKIHRLQQQIALMKERSRITADLHDDVGSALSSLQIHSTIARQLMDRDTAKAKHYLDKIIEQSSEISSNVSDIIWSMKTDKDRLADIDGRIKNTVSNLLGAIDIDYSITIEKNLETIVKNITARKNIILIIKEATNNCAKYSAATKYNLCIEVDEKFLNIAIADNGKGIPEEKLSSGNGLQNMRKRIEELKGTMQIDTDVGKGTQLKFIVPLTEIRG